MEIPRKAWQNYISKLSKINKKAAQIMTDWIDVNGYDSIENMIAVANGLTQKYGEASAALACEMYDSIAAASGVAVPPAIPAEVMPEEYVAQAVRKTVDQAPTTVPNVVGRMVKQAGADTMLQNARRGGAQFAWIPSGDTCAFCITLASRGWQYMRKNALKNGHAEHIHSNCDCEYAIRFSEKDDVAGYDPQKYEEMYRNADGNTPQEKINAMRRAFAEKQSKSVEEVVKKIEFIPADTKTQAQEFAYKFGVSADYQKYDISVANAINKTIFEIDKEFGSSSLSALKTIGQPRVGNTADGTFDGITGHLSLKGVSSKNSLEKMALKNKRVNDRYEKLGLKYFAVDDEMATIHHEFGHIVHSSLGGTAEEFNSGIDKDIISFMRGKAQNVVNDVSFYADKNRGELVAECFSKYMNNEHDEITDGIIEILKKYAKK